MVKEKAKLGGCGFEVQRSILIRPWNSSYRLEEQAMGMELRSKSNQTGRASKPDLEVEAKKRRRTLGGANLVGSNDVMREDIMCVVEGDMWEDSTCSEYEALYEEERGSDYEV